MNVDNDHLPGIEKTRLRTRRLETRTLASGPHDGEPVLFLHGNLASATYWEETMLALPDQFRAVAVDQRGFGLSDPEAQLDATRGVGDWADDAAALADEFGWGRFHLVAHSLGGCVAWALLGMAPHRLLSVTLVAPGPPCGFGGAHGQSGELNHEDGAGSGAGLVHPDLVSLLQKGERDPSSGLFSPRTVMNRLCWQPPFRPAREEQLLTAMLQIHLGEGHFPGDVSSSSHWPGFAPGQFGPINAISPRYNGWVLPQLSQAPEKPPLLWIHGDADLIVCDASPSDPGAQGKLGYREGWPGPHVFPPQPLLQQVQYAVDQYRRRGGTTEQLVLPGVGHTPYLEQPERFQSAMIDQLKKASGSKR